MKLVIDVDESSLNHPATVTMVHEDGPQEGPFEILDGVGISRSTFTGRTPNELLWTISFRTRTHDFNIEK